MAGLRATSRAAARGRSACNPFLGRSTSRIRALALALGALAVTPASSGASQSVSAPQIVTIATSPAVAHTGDVVNWTVLTTPDVSAVSAHVYLYTIPLRRMQSGHFAVSFAIPRNVPALFHGRYTVSLTATTPGGKSAQRSFVMDFR